MSFVRNDSYCLLPFCAETPLAEFYTYSSLQDLAAKSEMHKENTFRCRTIGLIQSINGRFFLSDLDVPVSRSEPIIQISLVYMKEPPPSAVIPYGVQVFGTLQWKNRPVIFVKMLQPYTTAMAIRLRNAMESIGVAHSAKI